MVLLDEGEEPPYEALSMDEAFPESLKQVRDYVEGFAKEIQVHQDAVALMMLTSISATLGKKAEVLAYPPHGIERAPLWSFIVMEPGERKTAIMEELPSPMKDYSQK